MKKYLIIILSLLLLTSCANSHEHYRIQPTDYISNIALSETIEALPQTKSASSEVCAETDEAPDNTYTNPAYAAHDAFMEHFDRGEYLHLPSNYQGIYYDGDVFVIQISDEDQSPYDFLSEYGGLVRIETVKYTRKELEALRDIPWNILKDEHSIDVVSNGIDHKNNAIEIEVFDRYTDEEKAEIASYVEDYPVIIKYVDYHHITAAEALDMLYNSFEFNERGTRDYPDDYAGYYFDGDFGQDNYVLAVLITDENSTRYDFLKGYEKVRFETAEHSLNELWEIRAQLPSELIKELDLPFLGAEINMRQNIIEVTFDETCSEEQRAAITEYAADKPVTVGYAPKPYPELQSAI